MNHYDVIIVGGGPAGSSCATQLARAGIDVLVFDRERFPRDKICGDCINPDCWQYFELLDAAERVKGRGIQAIRNVHISLSSGKSVSLPVSAHETSPFFAMKRSELDFILLQNASQHGAQIKEKTNVFDAHWSGTWQVRARSTGESAVDLYTSRFLVGADGRNSVVARLLASADPQGRRLKRKKGRLTDRVGIQWHAPYQPVIGSAVELFLFDSGYCGLVNINEECSNVAMVVRSSVLRQSSCNISELCHLTLGQNIISTQRLGDLTPLHASATAFPIDPAIHHSGHPYAYLIGDAHRTVEPFTGEGVFFALQDGVWTARTILERMGAKVTLRMIKRHSSFYANHLFSPALRREKLAHALMGLASRIPSFVHLPSRVVFRESYHP